MKTIYTIFTLFMIHTALQSQCYMDQHSTTWYDNWTSCSAKPSPNPERKEGHWIMYNLGHNYLLGKSHWWNGNEADATDNGIKRLLIEVSVDGIHWQEVTTMELPQAPGINQYEGVDGPDFDHVAARYILITGMENYGGRCYSLGEMKVEVTLNTAVVDAVSQRQCLDVKAYPNPFTNTTVLSTNNVCSDKAIVTIEDATGRTIATYTIDQRGDQEIYFNGKSMASGIYFIHIQNNKERVTKKLMKID